ncbi:MULTISPECIES: CDP-glycerol glycerophosphotransferase family protein [Methanothermobacter]|uniref:CDP-glycerol glycerophosphotransferase family protein n=1 Tax=Methanothermobacter TaxID=145260 RepID=UPI00351AEA4C
MLQRILKIINYIIPKNRRLVVFDSAPDFTGNSMALFEFMDSRGEFEALWIADEPERHPEFNQVKRDSIRALLRILRAGTLVSTHGRMAEIRVPSQRYVNLWHGMPLKAMAYAETTGRDFTDPVRFSDENYYMIATSTIMRNALAACFNQDARRIHVTGQPRNDKLFREPPEIPGIDTESYSKVVLFAPTFRKSDFLSDGDMLSHNLNFPDFNPEALSGFLTENNVLLLVKFHPAEEKFAEKFLDEMENVALLRTEMLKDEMLDINDILAGVDVLVTDYSSIYFDFLLLDRPIIFAVSDLEEYARTRSFVLEPFEFWTPGPKVRTFREFLDELERSLNDPQYYAGERRTINELVNHYRDDRSSERVYRLVFQGEDGE